MGEVLFERDGETYVPSVHTVGPWGEDLLHGGAVAALAVTVLEADAPADARSVRLVADLVRPLRAVPFTIETAVVRGGRRLTIVEARVHADGSLVARCSLTRFTRSPVELHADLVPAPAPPPDDPEDWPRALSWNEPAFFGSGMEVRVAEPERFMGSDVGWFRLARPVLSGVEPSPMTRAAAVADFGNGISGLAPPPDTGFGFPNANVDVHLSRDPVGEWIRLDARSIWREDGTGLTSSALSDREGPCGLAVQNLVLT